MAARRQVELPSPSPSEPGPKVTSEGADATPACRRCLSRHPSGLPQRGSAALARAASDLTSELGADAHSMVGHVRRRLSAALEVELGEDRTDVVLDGLVREEHLRRDLLVRHALGDEEQDRPFPPITREIRNYISRDGVAGTQPITVSAAPCGTRRPGCACPWQHGRCGPAAGLLEVVPQLAAAGRVAQLKEGLGLDLADPLAGHVDLLADLLERPGTAILEAETELQHSALTAGE